MDLLEVFKDSEDLVEYPAGTVILEEGQHGDRMFVVMQGELSISLKDKVLGKVRPGEIIGEIALINAKVRSATVIAANVAFPPIAPEGTARCRFRVPTASS